MAVKVHFQSTGTVPGNGQPVAMIGGALTIGRSADNDMVLPDPDKAISKRHCAIELDQGRIMVIDLSTNGTFLNYSKMPIGEIPAILNHGDVLTIGSYELMVEINDETAPVPELQPAPMQSDTPGRVDAFFEGSDTGDDFLNDLLGEGAPLGGPSSVRRADDYQEDDLLPPLGDDIDPLLDPAPQPEAGQRSFGLDHTPAAEDHFRPGGVTTNLIPEDWDDLLGDEPLAAPNDTAASPPGGDEPPPPLITPVIPEDAPIAGDSSGSAHPKTPPEGARPAPPSAASTVPVAQGATRASDEAARAFLKTAGAGGLDISDDELVATLSRMGHVMRILIKGIREVLMTRTSMKSEFRIQQTMIGAGGNNPLKFSISPEQAVEAMVKPSTTGYLDAIEAAEQALNDIKAHEIAVVTGMEAALKDVLRQLSPAELEKQMQDSGGIGGLLKGRKARYWEVYEKMYAEISDRAENEFHEMFSREFARAYQAQLERLK